MRPVRALRPAPAPRDRDREKEMQMTTPQEESMTIEELERRVAELNAAGMHMAARALQRELTRQRKQAA